jgi:GT2 family glycosyltransferase
MMVRRAVWQDLGGFDEDFYPVWFEDVDFCRRIQQRGLYLYHVPEAVAKHTGGHSIAHLSLEMRRVYWYRSLLRYSAKHFRPWAFRAVCAAVVLGSTVRSVAESVLHRSFRPIAIYGLVARLAGRGMVFGFLP